MTATQERVKAIHSSVDEASDVLLQHAPYDYQELQTLRELGFINCENAKDIEDFVGNSQYARQYKQTYPHYKFITEHQMEKIRKKYNLLEGNLSSFKGNIPAKNIMDMKHCKIKASDIKEPEQFMSRIESWADLYSDMLLGQIGRPVGFSAGTRPDLGVSETLRTARTRPVNRRSDYQKSPWLQQIEENPFVHRPDQMLTFKDIVEYYPKAVTITADRELFEIPDRNLDPIVTVAVKGGYLIVTAWGPEASDPEVQNPIMN